MRSDGILKVDKNGWGRRNQAPKCPVWGIASHILWILPWFWDKPQARRWLVPRGCIKLRGQNFLGEWSTGWTSPYFSRAGCPMLWSCTLAPIALCYMHCCFSPQGQELHVTSLSIFSGIASQIRVLKLHQNHRGSMFKNAALHSYPALLSQSTGVSAGHLHF